MTDPLRVLVVEDTDDIADLIRRALTSEGCEVDHVSDLTTARARLAEARYDVIVLDLELPDGSGLDLVRDRQASRDVPIVILSARGNEIDRVVGLELGAEDYMVKPFYPRELATRVHRAAARRRPNGQQGRGGTLDFGELQIDLDGRRVTVRGAVVEMTPRELDLLTHLATAPGRVFTRAELLRDVWQSDPEWQTPTTVTEHIRRLRLKIELDPGAPRWLVTVRSTGYRFDP